MMRFFKHPTRRELCRELHNAREARDALRDEVKRLVKERDDFKSMLREAEEKLERCQVLFQRERFSLRDQLLKIIETIATTPLRTTLEETSDL